jgi:hypothetical protein
MDDCNSVRCKACDTLFNSTWDEETKQWEDLCWECLSIALYDGYDDNSEEILNEYTPTESTDYY